MDGYSNISLPLIICVKLGKYLIFLSSSFFWKMRIIVVMLNDLLYLGNAYIFEIFFLVTISLWSQALVLIWVLEAGSFSMEKKLCIMAQFAGGKAF